MNNSTEKLPIKTRKIINNYLNLKIGSNKIRTPYYQNISGKFGKPVYIGKGTPEVIEQAFTEKFNRLNKDISKFSHQQIRYYMLMLDIGIDCSGFVMRVLESYLNEEFNQSLQSLVKPIDNGLVSRSRHKFRFHTNLSADTLTSFVNTKRVL